MIDVTCSNEGSFSSNTKPYTTIDPKIIAVAQMVETWPDWAKVKFNRFLIRLQNDDPKVERLRKLLQRGQITRWQFLEMM